MIKYEKGYVVVDSQGRFWCGYNTWLNRLYKAKIYISKKQAIETAERFKHLGTSIIDVEVKIIKEII